MNTFGYIVRRMARSFGFKNERERLVAARRETTLLCEAESLLGQLTWEHTENIEDLSEEYWQIKEIDSKQKKLHDEITECEKENAKLHEAHARLEEEIEREINELSRKKSEKMQEALKLMHQAEEMRDVAEQTKKKFSGIKTKYKVLAGEGGNKEQLDSVVTELRKLKETYVIDKQHVAEITARIQHLEADAAKVVEEIERCRTDARKRLTTMMSEVGKSSSMVAKLSANIGALNRTKKDLIYRVGAFLGINADSKSPEIRKVISKGRGLISRISTLRRSIAFNRLLAGRPD